MRQDALADYSLTKHYDENVELNANVLSEKSESEPSSSSENHLSTSKEEDSDDVNQFIDEQIYKDRVKPVLTTRFYLINHCFL